MSVRSDSNFDRDATVSPATRPYDTKSGGGFPITNRYVFSAAERFAHSVYFSNPPTQNKIADRLLSDVAVSLTNR